MATKAKLRAVFDTNVYVARMLSKSPDSPTIELFERLKNNEFILIYCKEILDEIIEKLVDKGIDAMKIAEFIAEVTSVAERIDIEDTDVLPLIPTDPDDNVVVACTIKGKATHLVIYDPDFAVLGGEYQSIKVLDGLHFLYTVRSKLSNE